MADSFMSQIASHPLLPGIRSRELHNRDWPRTLHDGQITGFSPLKCNMSDSPDIWSSIEIGGEIGWIEQVIHLGEPVLLICDNRLRMVSLDGTVCWHSPETGDLCFFGDLRGNGQDCLLISDGPSLILMDAATGQTLWRHGFDPPYVKVRVAVGNILTERKGLEAAVFLAYGDQGCLFHFPEDEEPETIWRRSVVLPEEWPERYDHGCDIKLDLTEPDEPLIWNVRHHRCRSFHARTGDIASSLVYQIEGQRLRNYGPWAIGCTSNGHPLICVVSENVQEHVHAIRLHREGENELAWSHYYGELYIVPGVALEHITIADVDGDGETEVVYNVRDPELDYRSFVRVRSGATGVVRAQLQDAWCVGTGPNGTLLVLPAPDRTTPVQGDLTVYRFDTDCNPIPLNTVGNSRLHGTPIVEGDLLLHQQDPDGTAMLVRHAIEDDGLREVSRNGIPQLLEEPINTCLPSQNGLILLTQDIRGMLNALTWEGDRLWQIPLAGGGPPTLSAADLNGDGRAELAAATAGNRVRLFSLDNSGAPEEFANHEFLGDRSRNGSPLLFDLKGTGGYCLVAPGSTDAGDICVCAWQADGTLLWNTTLGVSTAQGGQAIAWNAGMFLPGSRAGVAVSVNNQLRNIEGTFLLDGATGEVLWHKTQHRMDDKVRPYLPHGIPTAYDFDGDGLEEIMMDMLSYMAVLRGNNGGFVYLNHTKNMGEKGALYAGDLYNSYVPVYRTPEDELPHWFVPLGGYGSFGLMKPDPEEGLWRDDPGYDVPYKVALVDADGDGILEAGYVLKNHRTFVCRNLWTGAIKWQIELPDNPVGPVITADVDGDGKGEFLIGRYCIGTDDDGMGEIRWESPVSLGWAIIADFDGDGVGEIACPAPGRIVLLKHSK